MMKTMNASAKLKLIETGKLISFFVKRKYVRDQTKAEGYLRDGEFILGEDHEVHVKHIHTTLFCPLYLSESDMEIERAYACELFTNKFGKTSDLSSDFSETHMSFQDIDSMYMLRIKIVYNRTYVCKTHNYKKSFKIEISEIFKA